jgi:hypothetical protein
MLGIVVVPGYIVVIQKCKQRLPVLLEAVPDFLRGVAGDEFGGETLS